MKLANVKWIYLREVRDQLRDRRTLFTIAVLPVLLYPLLGMTFLQVAQFSREHKTPILLLGADSLPETPRLLDDDKFDTEIASEQDAKLFDLTIERALPPGVSLSTLRSWAEQEIQDGTYDAVVYFPDDFGVKLNEFRAAVADSPDDSETELPASIKQDRAIPEPELFVDTASDKSRMARDRVDSVLVRWRDSIVVDNLRDRRIPSAATKPFKVVSTDVSRERTRRAAVWSKILPFVVLIWALTGAFYPAIDLCAGEKERGTLETLLCSPAERSEIAWGKLLTIMTFSMATSVLNLLSMGMTGAFIVSRIAILGGGATKLAIGTPPPAAFLWLLLALIPLSALFSAISLAIAAFAKSSKEGQYYLMPVLMITLPLMMLPMMPTTELDLGMSLIPVAGVMLLLQALIEGQYLEAVRFVVPVMGVTFLCCLLAMRWAIDQFNKESVLFRESEQWGFGVWIRSLIRDRRDTPSLSAAVMCGVLLLMIRFFASFLFAMPETWDGFAMTTVISLVAFIAIPAIIMSVLLTRSPTKTLLLRAPRFEAIPMAALLALALHPANVALGLLVQKVYPYSPDIIEQLKVFESVIDGAPGLWAVILVLAVTPAICEEIAFRGFILSGMRHMGHKWVAILVTSVLFGAAHMILQQSLTACMIGMVLGYLAIQTGSLLPCIVYHLTHNSLSMIMAICVPTLIETYPGLSLLFSDGESGTLYQWPAVAVGLVVGVGLLNWFRNLPYDQTKEESLQKALDHQTAQIPAKS
ncbi:MAG: CPBP family intramembrane metalloprotease [Planctomycetes bacterium]|nr:CPBP family intramembrane metalloprotease [Planctomycetota bacterium]